LSTVDCERTVVRLLAPQGDAETVMAVRSQLADNRRLPPPLFV
jgi:hypothetical protein